MTIPVASKARVIAAGVEYHICCDHLEGEPTTATFERAPMLFGGVIVFDAHIVARTDEYEYIAMSPISAIEVIGLIGKVLTAYAYDGVGVCVVHGIAEEFAVEGEHIVAKIHVLEVGRAFAIDGEVDLAINRIPREQANELVSNAIELGIVLNKLERVITKEFIRKLADGHNPILLIEQALLKREEHHGNSNKHDKS